MTRFPLQNSQPVTKPAAASKGSLASFFCIPFGAIAKRLCNGLQIRLVRFDSGSRLHFFFPHSLFCHRAAACRACDNARLAPVVKLVDTADLKSAAFPKGSVLVRHRPGAPAKEQP